MLLDGDELLAARGGRDDRRLRIRLGADADALLQHGQRFAGRGGLPGAAAFSPREDDEGRQQREEDHAEEDHDEEAARVALRRRGRCHPFFFLRSFISV